MAVGYRCLYSMKLIKKRKNVVNLDFKIIYKAYILNQSLDFCFKKMVVSKILLVHI